MPSSSDSWPSGTEEYLPSGKKRPAPIRTPPVGTLCPRAKAQRVSSACLRGPCPQRWTCQDGTLFLRASAQEVSSACLQFPPSGSQQPAIYLSLCVEVQLQEPGI
eukprot:5558530-Pyramimonas_sp.AAC.1